MTFRPPGPPRPNPIGTEASLDGDSVPKPLGFTAFAPEWLFSLGRPSPPRHSGPWAGAPVASLRCRILRPGEVSILRAILAKMTSMQKNLPERSLVG